MWDFIVGVRNPHRFAGILVAISHILQLNLCAELTFRFIFPTSICIRTIVVCFPLLAASGGARQHDGDRLLMCNSDESSSKKDVWS